MSRVFKFDRSLVDIFARVQGVAVAEVTKGIAKGFHDAVVPKTARRSGRAQGNWNVGVAAPDDTDNGPGGPTEVSDQDMRRIDGTAIVYVTNSTPYINKLENGYGPRKRNNYPGRPGDHMSKVAIEEVKSQIDSIISQALVKMEQST